ncbi:hypothetical protein PsorP6_003099 [Peronosclerospora sorghi]|uniref:Uncharacterized protein n=1 Tax=Peronosclerospora sorghi TaxID=230839 RepID=A0ACC0VL55_9STRA|nr:hypothetical protein PsorP6_003099 [Peronosclerospora sorghi]
MTPVELIKAMSKAFSEEAAALLVFKTSFSSDPYIAGLAKKLPEALLNVWKKEEKTPDDVFKIL